MLVIYLFFCCNPPPPPAVLPYSQPHTRSPRTSPPPSLPTPISFLFFLSVKGSLSYLHFLSKVLFPTFSHLYEIPVLHSLICTRFPFYISSLYNKHPLIFSPFCNRSPLMSSPFCKKATFIPPSSLQGPFHTYLIPFFTRSPFKPSSFCARFPFHTFFIL